MTTKTLTLSRWHLVAERLNTKAKELEARALGVFSGTVVTAFQNDEQLATLGKRREQALADVALARRLIATVGVIREALAVANAQHGVSAQLSRLEALNREVRFLGVFEAIDNDAKIQAVNLAAHFKTLENAENGRTRIVNGVSVALLPEATQDEWRQEREALQAQAHALSDTINDQNRHTVSLDLSDDVATIAGV